MPKRRAATPMPHAILQRRIPSGIWELARRRESPAQCERESVQRPNFNRNRSPNAAVRPREFTPEERQRLQRDEKRFRQLPPPQQQELRERAQVWQKMTPEQRDHVRNEVLPRWKQMAPERRQAIQQRLRVLQTCRNRRGISG